MATIRGTLQNGQIILAEPAPADWPDGAEVRVELVDPLRDDGQGTDPESIAEWLAWHDSLEPFLSEEDEAAWKKGKYQ